MESNEQLDFERRFREASARLEGHPGRAAIGRWRQWSIVVRTFRVNQQQLVQHIAAPAGDEKLAVELMQNVRPPHVADAYIGELYRLLHNYVASVKTLVDHSRNLLDHYENSSFRRAYQLRVQALSREPVVVFVQDLRNVLLHQRLPGVVTQIRWESADSDHEFSLDFESDGLLKIERFTKRAREYIESQGQPQWPVQRPVEHYGRLIDELCDWTGAQFQGVHGNDIDDYRSAIEAYEDVVGPRPGEVEPGGA